jgi:hypothetical protein
LHEFICRLIWNRWFLCAPRLSSLVRFFFSLVGCHGRRGLSS